MQVFRPAGCSRQKFTDLIAKVFDAQVVDGNTHHSKAFGQQLGSHQVEKGWNQLALRQVPGGSEQHEDAGTRSLARVLDVTLLVGPGSRCHT